MKTTSCAALWFLLSINAFVLAAEAPLLPDLVAKDIVVKSWTATSKIVSAVIYNIGTAGAKYPISVFFNGVEEPESINHRPQRRTQVDVSLAADGPGEKLKVDFHGLEHPDNSYLANVKKICVIVDPKNKKEEKDESNNESCVLLSK